MSIMYEIRLLINMLINTQFSYSSSDSTFSLPSFPGHSQIYLTAVAVLFKLHTPGWAPIRVNFDPTQEIWSKVGGGRVGPFSLDYSKHPQMTSELTRSVSYNSNFSLTTCLARSGLGLRLLSPPISLNSAH